MALKIDQVPAGASTSNVLTGQFERPIDARRVMLYDNTLREGEQPPGVVFTSDEKYELALALDDFGVHFANVGFPAVSKEEFQTVARIAKAGLRMKLASLSRVLPEDIDKTVDAGVAMVALFLGGSDSHLRSKLRLSEAEALGKIEAAVRRVKERGAIASFAVEDGSRTPLPRLLKMYQVAVEAGADYLVIADTVGVLTPHTTYRLVEILKSLLPRPIGLHFHDDLGLALANTLAGLEAGAEMAQVTVNGAGERSGNTCLEELVVALKVKYGVELGLKLDRLTALCERVHRASGTRPSEHKSITGKWCFTHESGIHVAGILAEPECYQPYPPQMVGREHEIVFGKHSGMQAVAYLAQRERIELSESARRAVLDKIKRFAESKQGTVEPEMVIGWMREA
jgi:isopropylmalate/homocitrate/citramalate synthase